MAGRSSSLAGTIAGMADELAGVIRYAQAGDAEGIRAIYAPIVRETAISFELEAPTVEEMRRRIEATTARLPWLVCEIDGAIGGYAYASRHRERAAYQWSADVSVYVAQGLRGHGLGKRLYAPLLGILEDLGYYSALAGIALPNPASVRLHEAMGFRPIGVYHKIGYKLGAWHDVGWWQRQLREYAESPRSPLSMEEYAAAGAIEHRLRGKP